MSFNAKNIGGFLGFGVFTILLLNPISPENIAASNMAAIAILMAIWWMTEALPLAATSLLPLVLMPLMGIKTGNETASVFFNSTNFLFMGGFMIALAMQEWNLHKRIALIIIRAIGKTPTGIVTGFIIASALLSMFISNVATTVLLLPIGLAVIYRLEEKNGIEKTAKFATGIMLAIAYAASIGGVATLVGTAPNLALQRIYKITFPDAVEITFANWLLIGVPIALTMIIVLWFVINKLFFPPDKSLVFDKSQINDEYKLLGKMKFEEKAVLTVLIGTAAMWLFRKDLELGSFTLTGWSSFFNYSSYIDDGTVAIFSAVLLFIIPSINEKRQILNFEVFSKIPWDILLIFGGGFALAGGFESSGLSTFIGQSFSGIGNLPDFVLVILVCLFLTFLTELTSNTATTYTLLPILASIAPALDVNPILLMLPATISASFAFMLPVATPPNAIVFGSRRIKINEMMKTGLVLNLIGVVVVSLILYFWGIQYFIGKQ